MREPLGDTDFAAFYRRELPALIALAASITGSHVAAEDLAQEALVRAQQRWSDVSHYDKPGAWVRRVTINLAISNKRKVGTESRTKLRLAGPEKRAGAPTMIAAPSHHEHIWAAVRQLPGKQRAAIALYYLEDRSVAEIADVLGCAHNTAKSHLHKGRATLRSLLENEGGRP